MMKRLIIACIALLVLSACGAGNDDTTGKEEANSNTSSSTEQDKTGNSEENHADEDDVSDEEDTNKDDESDVNSNKDNSSEDKANNDASNQADDSDKKLAEYPIFEDKVDMTAYTIDIKEDNPHKRIVLLKDKDGEAKYKSVFIKKPSRMKLIQFGHGVLFDEVID